MNGKDFLINCILLATCGFVFKHGFDNAAWFTAFIGVLGTAIVTPYWLDSLREEQKQEATKE